MVGLMGVFLFVPNIIGYARIAIAVCALHLLPTAPLPAVALYLLSAILDALDGHAARLFNQATNFGAMLDMVTDRSTTACLLVHLATIYPNIQLAFMLLIALDLSSHYIHMYSQIIAGLASHKTIRNNQNFLLKLYYQNSVVLFLVCAGIKFLFLLLFFR
jgi:CDP-diacylglycerol--inositol 3-phosphatidyltransferase